MKPLFPVAIYVNRTPEALVEAIRGKKISDRLVEHRPWTTGEKLLAKAHRKGFDVALIFAQYETLEYWAVAREIEIREEGDKKVTDYRFSDLQRIPGRRREREDLTVVSTQNPLPNEYIRSYVLVEKPGFLQSTPNRKPK